MTLSSFARPVETNPLHPDEPVYGLAELNLQQPDGKEHHRYQLVRVLRGSHLVWIRIDMGLATTADQFRVVSNPDGDTVASVQAYAEARRDDMYWQKFLAEQAAANTLITDAIHWHEEKLRHRRKQSKFGPGFVKQRN